MKTMRIDRNGGFVIALILLLYFVTHAFMLTRYPYVYVDEPWISTPPYYRIQTGTFKNPVFLRLGLESRHEKHASVFFVNDYSLLPIFYFFGTGVLQGRLWMSFLGLIILIYTYKLAKFLFNPRVAILSSFLLTVDSLFVYSTRVIRPEALGIALTVSSIYYYLLAYDKRKKYLAVASGFLCGLSVLNHPMGAFVAISIVFVTLKLEKRSFLKSQYLWIAGSSALFVFVGYFLDHSYSDLLRFKSEISQHNIGLLNRYTAQPIGYFDLFFYGLLMEIVALKKLFIPYRILVGAVLAVVVFFSAFVKMTHVRTVLLLIVAFLLWAILFPPGSAGYYGYVSPYVAVLVAVIVSLRGEDLHWIGNRGRIFVMIAVVLYVCNHVAYMGAAFYRNKNSDYIGLKRHFDEIPAEYDRVIGDYEWWFHLKERDYVQTSSLVSKSFSSLNDFNPQVIILSRFTFRSNSSADRERKMRKLRKYINEHEGRLLKTIKTSYYGPIEIYLLQGNLPST
ncbi:MAG: hypothetical protein GTO24_00175 [candidate division Zixibacteria bacterium]|nr:hypothetical protein [candidate division Zixibacteria bacterium]